jgi:general secretion pathway protein B
MSFILDALKKSELERQRQTTPGLIETGIAPRRPRVAVWVIVLGVLLIVNIAVLAFVLMRGSGSAAPTARHAAATAPPAAGPVVAAPAASQPSRAVPPQTASDHFSPMDAPVYAPEIPVVPAPAARAAHRADPAPDEDDKSDNSEVLPLMSEVNLTGASALPELHLDVHVYATKPSDRFVYINMRKYHEGATLEEGPTLERIRRDGVVLNFHGVRFILPRAVGQGAN